MPLFALIIAVILIVAAVRNSQGALFSAIGQDAPAFLVWAAAILAIGLIGFIPGLKPVSRALLALIIVVLFVNNYQKATQGFTNAWQQPGNKPANNSSGQSGNAAATGNAAPAAAGVPDFLSGFLNSNPLGNFTGSP